MKFLSLFLLLGFWACAGKPEPNLQLSNPEAFAFDLEDSWEVNASITATGFAQVEKNDEYFIKLSYTVDLVSPNSDTLVSIYNESLDENDVEEFLDLILEAQVEVDSSFAQGPYKLIFNVKDDYSLQTKSFAVDFNLSK